MNQPRPDAPTAPQYPEDHFRPYENFNRFDAEELGGFDLPLETTPDDVREYVRFLNL